MKAKGLLGFTICTLTSLLLTACGGGGSSAKQTSFNSNTPWTSGVFPSANTLKDFCQTPRSGIDPYTNQRFPDKAGSAMDEKMWLRSWSNDTYLWYNEIIDRNPNAYAVIEYFNLLKTELLDTRGKKKDNFHFYQPSAEYKRLSQGGLDLSYGIEWQFGSTTTPRELTVRFTEANSPANNAGITRGLKLSKINTVDFINSDNANDVNLINEALFPSTLGTSYNFTFLDPYNNNNEITVTMAASNITVDYVPEYKILTTNQGDTGYLRFNGFNRTGQNELITAFNSFVNTNVNHLILDLRYNGGGLLAMSSQLAYMVAGSQSNNATFEISTFNDKHPTRDPITQEVITPTPFYDKEIDWTNNQLTNKLLPSLNLSQIIVLTSEDTCSASEAFINGLRGIDVEVIQIGNSTCGKPYGFYPQDNCGTTYFTIQFQGQNNKGFGDYSEGFSPKANPINQDELLGCKVNDDLSQALGNENEAMLKTALHYVENNTCLAQIQRVTQNNSRDVITSDSIAIKKPNIMLKNNKIITPLTH